MRARENCREGRNLDKLLTVSVAAYNGAATLQTSPVCNGMDPDAQYTFEDLRGTDLCMEMHGMTFRTEALRQANLNLPHHCHYTDMLYTFCGVQASQTISFCPVTLYCYRLGRDGQSVSLESYRKHFDNYEKVTFLIAERAQGLAGSSAKEQLLIWRARDVAQHGIEICLRQPCSWAVWRTLKGYDKRCVHQYPKIARAIQNKNTRFLRVSWYGMYPLLGWWERRKYI